MPTVRYQNNQIDKLLFKCACNLPAHTMNMTFKESADYRYDDDGIYIEYQLYQHNSFFKRLWNAIFYVFGLKRSHSDWDCVVVSKEDVHQLRAYLDTVCEKLNAKPTTES